MGPTSKPAARVTRLATKTLAVALAACLLPATLVHVSSAYGELMGAINSPPLGPQDPQLAISANHVTAAWDSSGETEERGGQYPQSQVAVATAVHALHESAPQVVSEAGDSALLDALVTDRAGDQLVVWSASRNYLQGETCGDDKYTGCSPRAIGLGTWYSWRAAEGNFSPPQPLLAPAASNVRVAMNDRGVAIIAYDTSEGVWVQWGNASGRFGPAMRIAAHGSPDYLVVNRRGEAIVVCESHGAVAVSSGGPYRRFRSLHFLSGSTPSGELGSAPIAMLSPDGAALVGWRGAGEATLLAYRPAGAQFGRVRQLAGVEPLAAAVGPHDRARIILDRFSYGASKVQSVDVTRSGISRPKTLTNAVEVGHAGDAKWAAGDETGDVLTVGRRLGQKQSGKKPDVSLETFRSSAGSPFAREVLAAPEEERNAFFVSKPLAAVRDHVDVAARVPEGAVSARFLYPLLVVREWRASRGHQDELIPFIPPPPLRPRYAPASEVQMGTVAHVDRHGLIHTAVSCGSEEPGPCTVHLELVSAARTHPVLASQTVRTDPTRGSSVALALARDGARLLARQGRVNANVVTVTRSGTVAPTTTEFPVVVTRRLAR